MGISAAMTPKERKQIHAGLIEQGATVVRDGKRGTLYATPDGGRWMLPFGTSDHKARLAMRAEVRRLGLRWPLDPPPTPPKKEKPVPTHTAEAPAAPTTPDPFPVPREHVRVPSAVVTNAGSKPAEASYRKVEPLLRGYADKQFWTQELLDDIRNRGDIPGYLATSGMQRLQWMLDFAGFKVIDSEKNRSGYSYRWARPASAKWPTEFAPTVSGAALIKQQTKQGRGLVCDCGRKFASTEALDLHQQNAKHGKYAPDHADYIEPESKPVAPKPAPPVVPRPPILAGGVLVADGDLREATSGTNPLVMAEPATETEPAVPQGDGEAALDLASEMEQRALKAERKLAEAKKHFEEDLRAHENRHRIQSRRNAELEGMVNQRDRMISQLTAERDEARTLLTDGVDELVHEARSGGLTPKTPTPTAPVVDEGWWPLEGSTQTVTQLIESAESFGLEVRIQARRKA